MSLALAALKGGDICPTKEAFVNAIAQGKYVKHGQYGLGVVTESDAERTSIDFHLHGMKKFVTKLMVVEMSNEAPPPKPSTKRRKKAVVEPVPVQA
jgi:hypothetical protein